MNLPTLKARLRDKDRQKFFVTFLAGKMLGIVLAAGLVAAVGPWLFAKVVHAAAPGVTDPPIGDVVNATNTAWTIIAAFLVFFMQAGFMMLEAGFARTREVVNVLVECIVDTCLCALLFWAFGFAFMFGEGNAWIGHQYFFLNNAPATYGTTGVSFLVIALALVSTMILRRRRARPRLRSTSSSSSA